MTAKRIVLRDMDPAVAQREIEDFLIRTITAAGLSGGVLGLSGGIDSTTVAYLAASAFRRHRAEGAAGRPLTLLGLILPSATNDPRDLEDAREIATRLDIEHRVIPIQPMLDLFRGKIPDVLDHARHLGNLASEVRAVILSRYAAARRCLVLGTGNRDEDYTLGYFTKRGDGAVDVSPIGALPKRLVRKLAAHLGVPARLVNKTPAAGLWPGQTDEGELGFTYDFAELVIAGRDQGMTPADIAAELRCDVAAVERVIAVHLANRHKMSMPEIAQVTFL